MSSEKLRIMILDDEPIVCKRLRASFEKQGYDVDTFTEGATALEGVKNKEYDILITDLKMEGVDGMQIIDAVSSSPHRPEIIVITGFATLETARESFHKGVFDFIAKPFKLSEIEKVVERAKAKILGAGSG